MKSLALRHSPATLARKTFDRRESGRGLGRGALIGFALFLALGGLAAQEEPLTVTDWGLISGFQDYWENHFRRGRALVAEDLDGDGWVDLFITNPGDETFVFRNLGPAEDGIVRFAVDQVIFQGYLAFTASGSDYDGDGDLDIFLGCGGLEGYCLDSFLRNDSTPGSIQFVDVSESAGLRGPVDAGEPFPHASAGSVWGDYDRDGDQDLFVSIRGNFPAALDHKSTLWRNNGDGTFTDATRQANLDYRANATGGVGTRLIDFENFQYSSWIDIDNDQDLDLFINNEAGPNVLWKNLLVETGAARFENVTQEFSLPGEDLRYPIRSFASTVADFNNDGWQDLLLLTYFFPEPFSSPYGNGNGLFLNRRGEGFYNAATAAGINLSPGAPEITMGCQVADWNADGFPDIAIGAGTPASGTENRLLLSRGLSEEVPLFDEFSYLINFEPEIGIHPELPPHPEIPPYPYRSHAIVAVDIDRDGGLEMALANGAMASDDRNPQEPNRLFHFSGPGLGNTFRVRLRGNGRTDSTDAIGARAYVEIPTPAGTRRVFLTVLGGSAFSAQNEPTLTFGLGEDETVSRLVILWSSGCLQVLEAPTGGNPLPLTVEEDCWTCPGAPGPVEGWLAPGDYGCAEAPSSQLDGTVLDGEGPVAGARMIHRCGEPPQLTLDTRSGPDGTFSVKHRFRPGVCVTEILEPFGYLPALNPVLVGNARPGRQEIEINLVRGPEAHWPRSAGYWHQQIRSLISGRGTPRTSESEVEAWLVAIRARYPGLPGLASLKDLADQLRPATSQEIERRLRRELATTLLNLASGRLAVFTRLRSGGQVGDWVEETYHLLITTGADPAEAERLAKTFRGINQGPSFF